MSKYKGLSEEVGSIALDTQFDLFIKLALLMLLFFIGGTDC